MKQAHQLQKAARPHVRALKKSGQLGFLHPDPQRVATPEELEKLKKEMSLAVKYFHLAKQTRKEWWKYVWACGKHLTAVKEQLAGTFTKWVEKELGTSLRTAELYMLVYRESPRVKKLLAKNPDLPLRQVQRLLVKRPAKSKPDEEERKRKRLLNEALEIFQDRWPEWSAEDLDAMQWEFVDGDLGYDFEIWLGNLMNKLRLRVGRKQSGEMLVNDLRKRFKPFFPELNLIRCDRIADEKTENKPHERPPRQRPA